MNNIDYYISTVSDGNLGLHIGGDKNEIIDNRKKLASKLGFVLEDFIYINQIHSGKIQIVGENDKGKGTTDYTKTFNCDGLITSDKGIVLGVLVADCVPIIIFDNRNISVAHAGWKGTFEKITQNTIKRLVKLGSKKEDINVIIGPSIGVESYEVGNEVSNKFRDEVRIKKSSKKDFLDLKHENKLQAIESGIKIENIRIIESDTFIDKEYFSARRDGFSKGRFGAFIWIKK